MLVMPPNPYHYALFKALQGCGLYVILHTAFPTTMLLLLIKVKEIRGDRVGHSISTFCSTVVLLQTL